MTEKLHFRVYGCLALADLKVQEAEPRQGSSFCFTIFKDDKCLLLAASSEKERNKWLKDLKDAIQVAKIKGFISTYSSQFSLDNKSESGDGGSSLDIRNEDKPISHHVNTSVHVCWHRNISVSRYDLLVSVQHSLSGFLLRKFKNNNGWQKLWVVLSSLCLFFYKSYLDDSPLASLPLAGYRVLTPSPEDPITKDHVFKLQYKNHAYFFRAESEHIFDRWMTVIHYATLADEEKTYL